VRLRQLTPALSLAALLVAACDPNVVIGAKWRVGEVPMAGASAGTSGAATGGSAGSGGSESTGGSETAGTGGSSVPDAGAPGQAGAEGVIYFEADHEDGDLAIWDSGPDMDAGGYYADTDPPTYSSDGPTHSGMGSVEVTIDTSIGTAPIARLYRRIEQDSAYYSAWFYLLEDHDPSSWWSIFLYRAVRDRSDSIDLWSVDLIRPDNEDRLTLAVYDHDLGYNLELSTLPTVPIAQWFQLQAYLEIVDGQPSRLELWLDDQQVLARSDLREMPEGEPVYWVIGNGGDTLDPPVSTIYIDDAVISSTRVGP
jgi:hypothetical protein